MILSDDEMIELGWNVSRAEANRNIAKAQQDKDIALLPDVRREELEGVGLMQVEEHDDIVRQIVLREQCKVELAVREKRGLIEVIEQVAIPSLKYCEEKYGHDNMARLNIEATLQVLKEVTNV